MLLPITRELRKHAGEFLAAIRRHKYEVSPQGILFPAAGAFISGIYTHDVNGLDERQDHNLLTAESIGYILGNAFYSTSKISTWYQALQGANVTPLSTWTAANYTANATELTSTTEGYTGSTRPTFVPAAPTGTPVTVSSVASKAAYTIATATTLSVYGAALLSAQARGATTGVLGSASKFSSVRTLNDTDVFNCGYQVSLTSS